MESACKDSEETSASIVLTTANISPFSADDNFSEWLEVAKHELRFIPPKLQTQQLLRALPRKLHIAAIRAGFNPDTDFDECCSGLSQLIVRVDETKLAREFFHRNQMMGEDDESYAENLRGLSRNAFKDTPPQKVESWIMDQFKHGVRPYAIAEKLCEANVSSIHQLVDMAAMKRKELSPTPRVDPAGVRSNHTCLQEQQHKERDTSSNSQMLYEVSKYLANAFVREGNTVLCPNGGQQNAPNINSSISCQLLCCLLQWVASCGNEITLCPRQSVSGAVADMTAAADAQCDVGQESPLRADDNLPTLMSPPFEFPASPASPFVNFVLRELANLTSPIYQCLRLESNVFVKDGATSATEIGDDAHEASGRILACLSDLVKTIPNFDASNTSLPGTGPSVLKLKPFGCSQCNKSFSRPDHLKDHIAGVHGKLKPYSCNQCGKTFALSGHLKRHIAGVHKKLKPYACNQCDKSFLLSGHLERHITGVHKKLKPFACNQCDRSFSRSDHLKDHVASVHGTKA